MDFTELMQAFGAKVGLEGLAPDGDDTCRIDVDGMSISFMEHRESGTVVTWAEVSEPPPEGVSVLYRVLMESMFMGQATGGSTFSVEPETGKIFLHRVDPLQAFDLDSFCSMLERFVNVLEQWRKLIVDFRPVAAEVDKAVSGKGEEMPSFGGGFMQV